MTTKTSLSLAIVTTFYRPYPIHKHALYLSVSTERNEIAKQIEVFA